MLRHFPSLSRLAVAALLLASCAGCGIKGPLKGPPGATSPPPPPVGVELPSATERHD